MNCIYSILMGYSLLYLCKGYNDYSSQNNYLSQNNKKSSLKKKKKKKKKKRDYIQIEYTD